MSVYALAQVFQRFRFQDRYRSDFCPEVRSMANKRVTSVDQSREIDEFPLNTRIRGEKGSIVPLHVSPAETCRITDCVCIEGRKS